jgi:hypothetical protein
MDEEPRKLSPAERMRPELKQIRSRTTAVLLGWEMNYGDCKVFGQTPEEAETKFNQAWSAQGA